MVALVAVGTRGALVAFRVVTRPIRGNSRVGHRRHLVFLLEVIGWGVSSSHWHALGLGFSDHLVFEPTQVLNVERNTGAVPFTNGNQHRAEYTRV